MADVSLSGNSEGSQHSARGLWGPYWVSPSTGYHVSLRGANLIRIFKTTDSGATWTAQDTGNEITTSQFPSSFACYWDKETPGISTARLHYIVAQENPAGAQSNPIIYKQFDTATDTYASTVNIESSSAFLVSATNGNVSVGVTVAVNGNVYCSARGDNAGGTRFWRSTDGGGSFSTRTVPYESANDHLLLAPGNLADTADIFAFYWDASAGEWSIKIYDDSANTWPTETSIVSGITAPGTWNSYWYDLAVRHSDGHVLFGCWTQLDNAAADLLTFDTNSGTSVTAKGDVITNIDDCAQVAFLINQQNNDVYCGYLGNADGSQTWGTTVTPFFKKSTDGMASWGSQQSYGSGSGSGTNSISMSGGRTVNSAGGRYMPTWQTIAANQNWVNDGNDIEIGASASATIVGVTATAPAAALLGTIAAQRTVTVAGAAATAPAAGLLATIATVRIATVVGLSATAPAAGLLATIAAQNTETIVGVTATAPAAALTGAVLVARTVSGELATAPAVANLATISAVRIATVVGLSATAPAAGLAATVAAVGIVTITGVTATADAAALIGSVTSGLVITIAGEPATAPAVANLATIATVRITAISGELATAPAAALLATIAAVRITSVSGVTATATAAALEGVVTNAGIVAVVGTTATAPAVANAATLAAVRIVGISGELATASAAGLSAVITANAVATASVTGETALATAAALAGVLDTTFLTVAGFSPLPGSSRRSVQLRPGSGRLLP